MKTICFYFQIHQPFRLRRYRFFDIGSDHYYYDDFNNEEIIKDIARKSYIPANQTLLKMIKSFDKNFKVAFPPLHKNQYEASSLSLSPLPPLFGRS